ncbi:uncharacterized protein BDZ99DRAFT_470857 [Mytilinidion resinicola]|uniref:Uncharacterized protein n=1 Tax=Mytilinidion resinicola TaxID=574789 RepID=A0A6A6ZA53_9PEZI|nr:uncharacterized protein BDZ99DRAFT_470857 [Mytilinidion resinicola]KAF2817910.1 hypothetical protein BDZ99DRAFT_470857 [Mytilinidion resinicola]
MSGRVPTPPLPTSPLVALVEAFVGSGTVLTRRSSIQAMTATAIPSGAQLATPQQSTLSLEAVDEASRNLSAIDGTAYQFTITYFEHRTPSFSVTPSIRLAGPNNIPSIRASLSDGALYLEPNRAIHLPRTLHAEDLNLLKWAYAEHLPGTRGWIRILSVRRLYTKVGDHLCSWPQSHPPPSEIIGDSVDALEMYDIWYKNRPDSLLIRPFISNLAELESAWYDQDQTFKEVPWEFFHKKHGGQYVVRYELEAEQVISWIKETYCMDEYCGVEDEDFEWRRDYIEDHRMSDGMMEEIREGVAWLKARFEQWRGYVAFGETGVERPCPPDKSEKPWRRGEEAE